MWYGAICKYFTGTQKCKVSPLQEIKINDNYTLKQKMKSTYKKSKKQTVREGSPVGEAPAIWG